MDKNVNDNTAYMPKFSNLHFKEKEYEYNTVIWFVCMYAVIGIFVISVNMDVIKLIMTFVTAVVIWLFVLIYRIISVRMKKRCGYYFKADKIERVTWYKTRKIITYDALKADIEAGCMRYGRTGIEVGKGKRKIEFAYEIYEPKKQKQVRQCYMTLNKRAGIKLLPYDKRIFSDVDALYHYDRKRVYNLLMLIALMGAFAFVVVKNINGRLKSSITIILTLIIVLLMCLNLFKMFQSIKMTEKYIERIKTCLKEYENVKVYGRVKSYVLFAVSVVCVVVWNAFVVLYL